MRVTLLALLVLSTAVPLFSVTLPTASACISAPPTFCCGEQIDVAGLCVPYCDPRHVCTMSAVSFRDLLP